MLSEASKSIGAVLCSLAMAFATFWMPVANAGNISTQAAIETVATTESVSADTRQRLVDKLTELGAEQDAAIERVARLADAEVQQVLAAADQLPAGAGVAGVIGVFVIVLVVFELFGLTDILPFIRPVNR